MRAAVRPLLLLLLVFVLIPSAAMADSLDAARPSSFYQFSAEENVLLFGSGLTGNVDTFVTFSGPGGTITTEPQDGSSTSLDVAVPNEVFLVAGRYAITVDAVDDNGTRTIGPTYIDIIERPVEEPPLLGVPEGVVAEATDREGAVVRFEVSATTFAGQPLTPVCDHQSGGRYSMGTTSVSCSATDQFGTTTRSFFVVVNDTTRPELTVPADIVSDTQVVAYTVTAVDGIEGNLEVTCSPASGSTFAFGTTTVQCSASDSSFNRADASFHVTVRGGNPPSLVLPNDFSAEATGNTGARVDFVVSTDADATVDCTPPSGSLLPVGRITVQCQANGPSGTSFGTFHVTITDTTAPALELPADFTVESDGPSGKVVTYSARATDLVDGNTLIACTPASGSTFPNGVTTVSCSSTDSAGNRGTGSFQVTVHVTTPPPTLTLPNDFTVEATSAAGAMVTYVATTSADATLVCSPISGSTFAIATTTVNCTATNAGGSTSGSFKVTVADRTAPRLTLPSDITKEGNTLGGATVTFTATATDAVDGNVNVACTPASGSTFAVGTKAVACSATDAHGNASSGSFNVTVTDTTAPSLVLPANITTEATSASGAAVTYSASANDVVEGSVPIVCNPASGATFAFGTTTVQCTAADSRGNRSAGSFTVTVRDTTGPVLTLPASFIVEQQSLFGEFATYSASARDAVNGPVAITCTPASGSLFPPGPTTVNCSAKDASNNTSRGSFVVDVEDRTAPVISAIQALPANIWPANHQMEHVFVLAVAIDRVDILAPYKIISVTSNQPVTGPGDTTTPDWVITGPATVDLRSERTNNVERVYTITVQATDHAGNSTTASVEVHVAPGRRRP